MLNIAILLWFWLKYKKKSSKTWGSAGDPGDPGDPGSRDPSTKWVPRITFFEILKNWGSMLGIQKYQTNLGTLAAIREKFWGSMTKSCILVIPVKIFSSNLGTRWGPWVPRQIRYLAGMGPWGPWGPKINFAKMAPNPKQHPSQNNHLITSLNPS